MSGRILLAMAFLAAGGTGLGVACGSGPHPHLLVQDVGPGVAPGGGGVAPSWAAVLGMGVCGVVFTGLCVRRGGAG